jgi:putative phosphoribosyl transferase
VNKTDQQTPAQTRPVRIRLATGTGGHNTGTDVTLDGDLAIPANAAGIVLFAHGSGSSRRSPRNQFVARAIQEAGIATMLFDLLTQEEEAEDDATGRLRFDIGLLARRLIEATRWIAGQAEIRTLEMGYFGASTGGAAALAAAAEIGAAIGGVVSRGGRPDLAGDALERVQSPVLLIVGERDEVVLELNRVALGRLSCEKELVVIPRATHLFEEPGALQEVARLAADWFRRHLRRARQGS